MKRLVIVTLVMVMFAGCDSLRLAPTEAQKENAWSHMQTTRLAAQEAQAGNCGPNVCGLTWLGAKQAEAFATDYGMPEKVPQAASVQEALAEANWDTAGQAMRDSQQRPDAWQIADGVLEFGVGLAGLFGGVYGTRVLRFVTDAKQKSKALREIVEGNELFKKRNPAVASDFKDAHSSQSQDTRELVASMK